MPRPDKVSAVAEIAEAFRTSNAAVLTEYRGLSVKELTQLRRALGSGASFAIVKNTLTKIAAGDAGVDGLGGLLTGPTAVAFVSGDPVEAAKGLRDFARTHPALVLKGGVVEGKPVSAQEIRQLADLESREVLLAKLAGAMQGSLSKAVATIAAPLSQFARLAAALQDQRSSGGEGAAEGVADGAADGVAETAEPAGGQSAEQAAEPAAEPVTEPAAEPA
ncbi:MAG: 50S ribosomal protein L10 [Frankiaceae bacterium]